MSAEVWMAGAGAFLGRPLDVAWQSPVNFLPRSLGVFWISLLFLTFKPFPRCQINWPQDLQRSCPLSPLPDARNPTQGSPSPLSCSCPSSGVIFPLSTGLVPLALNHLQNAYV